MANAQDLDQVGKGQAFKLSGNLSMTGIYYNVNGIESRRKPFSYFLNGTLTGNLYGWTVPVSASVSNENTSFRQPFNQYGLSPTYKNITLHAGYRNLTFSPYTLNGHVFLGGGAEWAPGDFKFAAMYGRLQKAVEVDPTALTTAEEPAYQRKGMGFKAGVEKNGDYAHVIGFMARDDLSSINFVPEDSKITPEANLVTGFQAQKRLFKKFVFNIDYASSAFTRDRRITEESTSDNVYSPVQGLFDANSSTYFSSAFKSSFGFQTKVYTLKLGYERVEPEYRSLGTYFFTNDFENITVQGGRPFFKNKLTLMFNVGVQRNNLLETELNTNKRFIGAVMATIRPAKKWNVGINYSNFTMSTRIRSAYEQFSNIDTLNLTQVTNNTSVNVTHPFGDKDRSKNLTLVMSYQQANNNQGTDDAVTEVTMFNSNLSYSKNIKILGLTYGASLNYIYQNIGDIQVASIGPAMNVKKTSKDEKWMYGLLVNFNTERSAGNGSGSLINAKLNATRKLTDKQSFTGNLAFIRRNNPSPSLASFTENTFTLAYNMNF